MVKKTELRTGETVSKSGIYQIKGTKDEMVLSTGDRVPPYDKEAAKVVLIRAVKHHRQ